MKLEEIEGRVKMFENAIRLQFPNCIVTFEIDEKELYLFGNDAVIFAIGLGAKLEAGKDGYYTHIPVSNESFIVALVQETGRNYYKFQEITKIKPTDKFSLN